MLFVFLDIAQTKFNKDYYNIHIDIARSQLQSESWPNSCLGGIQWLR